MSKDGLHDNHCEEVLNSNNMEVYKKSLSSVEVALESIGDSLNLIGQSMKTKESLLSEINERIETLKFDIKTNEFTYQSKIKEGVDPSNLKSLLDDITNDKVAIFDLERKKQQVENDLNYDLYIKSEKRKHEEASYSLYNYLKKEIYKNINDLLNEGEDITIIENLTNSRVIKASYHDYKIDFAKGIISLDVDFIEFSKVYMKVAKDIKSIYKNDLDIIKENERIDKLNRKIKRENRLIVAGMFGAFGKMASKLNKKR